MVTCKLLNPIKICYANIFFYFRGYSCIVDCVQKEDLTDFEPYMDKFVELDLGRFVNSNKKHVEMMIDLLEKKKFNLLKPLVQACKDKNPQDPSINNLLDKETLLHRAAMNGKLEIVQFLVPLLSDKNPKDNDDWTPLHWAAKHGHLEIVMYLCDQIQDKNPKIYNGNTPLHSATSEGKTEVVKYLVSVVDDKHPKDKYGDTPLDDARRNGHTEIVNILEKY